MVSVVLVHFQKLKVISDPTCQIIVVEEKEKVALEDNTQYIKFVLKYDT